MINENQKEDSGKYYCVAFNTVGLQSRVVNVEISGEVLRKFCRILFEVWFPPEYITRMLSKTSLMQQFVSRKFFNVKKFYKIFQIIFSCTNARQLTC